MGANSSRGAEPPLALWCVIAQSALDSSGGGFASNEMIFTRLGEWIQPSIAVGPIGLVSLGRSS